MMSIMVSLDLINSAIDVNNANLALGNDTFEAAGATFVRNYEAPDIYEANHVTNIRVDTLEAVDALFARVDTEYDGYRHRRYDVDHRTHPTVTARLQLEDYERSELLVMLLDGDLIGAPRKHEIRPVVTEEDWHSLAVLKLADWLEGRQKHGRPPQPEVGEAMTRVDRAKCPPVQYFLAYANGEPVAYLNSWAGIDGIGQVENLFTVPTYRNRGIATALIHRCVRDCREKGADAVIIGADPTDTPKHIYASVGFRPVAVSAHYVKRLPV
jgi:GNAT superfamily N-acetyltransferase